MKTEYIALHTAINLFEDYRTEVIRTTINIHENAFRHLHLIIPNQIANLLFYIEHDTLPLNVPGSKTINGINLYGKNKESGNKIVQISIKNKLYPWYLSDTSLSNDYYVIKCGYDYKTRYAIDFNYAVLTKYHDPEILYTELSVKYDEFLDLMTNLKNYITEHLEKMKEYYEKDDED